MQTGHPGLDAGFSLLAADPEAWLALVRPDVVDALLRLRAKTCCLVEVDRYEVALHTGHHGRTVELARDAVVLARRLGEGARPPAASERPFSM